MATNIVANNTLQADVFATIACALPPKDAIEILNKNNLDYLIFHKDTYFITSIFKRI